MLRMTYVPEVVRVLCVYFVQDLFDPQTGLLRYVLEQPYSRDMVCNMLGLNKQVPLSLSFSLSCLPPLPPVHLL